MQERERSRAVLAGAGDGSRHFLERREARRHDQRQTGGRGARSLALLHCVSAYPTPSDQQNLAAIRTLATVFGLPVGLSDHTTEADGVAVAVTLGACLYERHVKASDTDDVIDAAVSASPAALARIIATAAATRAMLGDGVRRAQPAERPNHAGSRRGLYAARDIAAGDIIAEADLVALRPEHGVPADCWRGLAGTVARRAIAAFTPFELADLAADDAPADVTRPAQETTA